MLKEAENRFALDPVLDHRRKVVPVCDESTPVVYYMGQRIYFRPFELADEPMLRRWINDPRIWSTLHHRGPMNASRETEWIESQGKSKTDYVFAIVVKDEERLIGSAGLHQIDARTRSATFGLLIGDVAYQNRGFGSEATRLTLKYGFRELNLNRIQLGVFANNWRAIRAYQKAGFVHEGCLRQSQYSQGEYVDEYRFAILREEWEGLTTLNIGDNFRPAGARRSVDIA